jgi:hypothetical protein
VVFIKNVFFVEGLLSLVILLFFIDISKSIFKNFLKLNLLIFIVNILIYIYFLIYLFFNLSSDYC